MFLLFRVFYWSVCGAFDVCLLCLMSLFKSGSSSSGKDRIGRSGREKGGSGFRTPNRGTTSSNPAPRSPPSPPPRPPVRSRRKSKSPASRSGRTAPKQALDLDRLGGASDPRAVRRRGLRDPQGPQFSELDRKWEGVALELQCRGSRMRSAVYQTSDLPTMVKVKKQLDQGYGRGQMDRSKLKATFV